jgi:hypothetical protein
MQSLELLEVFDWDRANILLIKTLDASVFN